MASGDAGLGGPTMLARIGVMQALNRHVELVFKRATDPQKKELFDRLADHLAMVASELERAIEAKGP
jgi:hypothetical protein